MDIYPAKVAESAIDQAHAHAAQAQHLMTEAAPYGRPSEETRRGFAEFNTNAAQTMALIAIAEELAAIRAALTKPAPARRRLWSRREKSPTASTERAPVFHAAAICADDRPCVWRGGTRVESCANHNQAAFEARLKAGWETQR